ncbi:5-methyltetrahydropteroyltriglutamate--homocysteine methyltransferase [Sulfolobales archaeon HS-7]|nr:5-methyltetrahydropteroyltriglutamate--homocysteine methyltransferase [Sulfolobales archaeon HS-7]
MFTELVGSYPRPYVLNEYIKKFRSEKVEKEKFDSRMGKFKGELLNSLINNNFSFFTDGMLEYDDIVDVVFHMISGIKRGELTRFYDNNFYYRTPTVKEKITCSPEQYLNRFKATIDLANKLGINSDKIKAYTLGPLTFSQMAEDNFYNDRVELAFEYSKSLKECLTKLEKYTKIVEIHEPGFYSRTLQKKVIERSVEIYDVLKTTMERRVYPHFNISLDRLELLFRLDADVVGVDIVGNIRMAGNIYNKLTGKKISLGVVDARTTKMETKSKIRRIIEKALDRKPEKILLSNNTFLDFIPEIVAKRKLVLLSQVAMNE